MRVNPNFAYDMVNLINQARATENKAAKEVSTERKVNLPSDNPAAEAAMLSENSQAASVDQYTANSDSLKNVLNTANSTLSSVVSLLQRAITLGTEGANGTMNQSNLNSISAEVANIKSQVTSLANTTYSGQYLFSGTATTTAPYTVDSADPTQVDYNGNSNQNEVQVGTGLSVKANLPGSSIFSQSGSNIFTALQSMVTALNAGDSTAVGTATNAVSSALSAISTAQVFYGNTVNELTSNETFLSEEKVNITTYQDSLVAVDTATAATDLTQSNTALTATIEAAAKISQVSLLDYLK